MTWKRIVDFFRRWWKNHIVDDCPEELDDIF
jgi:hypothetical protein